MYETFSTSIFAWDPDAYAFIAEHSTVAPYSNPGTRNLDAGFWLKSHVTGDKLFFSHFQAYRNNEGELERWEWWSENAINGRKIRLVLFND
jgi:hypothetical protein